MTVAKPLDPGFGDKWRIFCYVNGRELVSTFQSGERVVRFEKMVKTIGDEIYEAPLHFAPTVSYSANRY